LKETKNISQTAGSWSCSKNTVKLAIKKEKEGNFLLLGLAKQSYVKVFSGVLFYNVHFLIIQFFQ